MLGVYEESFIAWHPESAIDGLILSFCVAPVVALVMCGLWGMWVVIDGIRGG